MSFGSLSLKLLLKKYPKAPNLAKPHEYKLLSDNKINECCGPALISIIFWLFWKVVSFRILLVESYSCDCESKYAIFSTNVGWSIFSLCPNPNCPKTFNPQEYNFLLFDNPKIWPPPNDNFINLICDIIKGIELNFFDLLWCPPFPNWPKVFKPYKYDLLSSNIKEELNSPFEIDLTFFIRGINNLFGSSVYWQLSKPVWPYFEKPQEYICMSFFSILFESSTIILIFISY